MATRLHLEVGADPAAAANRLGDLIMLGGNVNPRGAGPQGIVLVRDEYLNWVELLESCLREITQDRAPISELFTAQYWAIRALASNWREISDPRPYPLVYEEVQQTDQPAVWVAG